MTRAAPLALLLAACAPPGDDPDVDALVDVALAPPSVGGCGDVVLYARDATNTHAVFVHLNGFATDAATAGQPVLRSVHLPDADVWVEAEEGRRLTVQTCVGAQPPLGPVVRRSWTAVAGTVQTRVTPDPAATPSFPVGVADVRLIDLVFADASGQAFRLPYGEITGVSVGLYPP